jgi:hypothetical protein
MIRGEITSVPADEGLKAFDYIPNTDFKKTGSGE